MTPLDDHSQRRQPLFFPVVIATALLAIIGMIGGYLLSERHGSKPVPVSGPTLLPAGQECLWQTQEMGAQAGATGTLRQVLRVRTESRTVAWICQDEVGRLYYHANKGGPEATWVENKTALFLTGVQHDDAGNFWVTAVDGAIFRVNKYQLVVEHGDGEVEEQDVVPE
ncbi:hypothetical protein [Actinoplanes subglobosus]|uniref:Uncharacterized protein n=1 Tax=Actinoplanes subglobosus TaxID=1547892 RepID=A0ABV8JGF6_9ACTN